MKPMLKPSIFVLIASALFQTHPAIAASFSGSTYAEAHSVYTSFGSTSDSYSNSNGNHASSSSSGNITVQPDTDTYVTAGAHASSEAGAIHIDANTSAGAIGVHQYAYLGDAQAARASSAATASLQDSFIVNASGLANGTHAKMTVAINVEGSSNASGSATTDTNPISNSSNGGWSSQAAWGGVTSLQSYTYGRQNTGLGNLGDGGAYWSGGSDALSEGGLNGSNNYTVNYYNYPKLSFGAYTVTLDVWLGGTVNVQMSGIAESYAGINADNFDGGNISASGNVNLSNTLGWGGILSLVDDNGQQITDFSAFNTDSSFDYAKAYTEPVPEPKTYALMLAGLGLIGFARRNPQK